MCFQLYAGTVKPIPRAPWNKDAPSISVEDVRESEQSILAFFSSPYVQFIGSTCGCGCDFPSITEHRGEWPWWDELEPEPEHQAVEQQNREHLAILLRSAGEEWCREGDACDRQDAASQSGAEAQRERAACRSIT